MSLTEQIQQMQRGNAGAQRLVFESAYEDLQAIARRLMKREHQSRTLSATGLLHEAFAGPLQRLKTGVRDRAHFYALAAISMRRILVDQSRMRRAAKRTADTGVACVSHAVTPSHDPALLDLVRAVDELRRLDPGIATVVEMKHYLGLTLDEIARETNRSQRKVREDWDFARAWLLRRLSR